MLQDPHWISEVSLEYRTSTKILHILISFLLNTYELHKSLTEACIVMKLSSREVKNCRTPRSLTEQIVHLTDFQFYPENLAVKHLSIPSF